MIGGVTKEIGGTSEAFRLTTRAMMALEETLGSGIVEILQGMDSGFRLGVLVRLIAECANNGKGQDLAWAQGVVDEVGMKAAGLLVAEIAEAAFPEASEKNVKRAAQSK